jgi:hypothetical protein
MTALWERSRMAPTGSAGWKSRSGGVTKATGGGDVNRRVGLRRASARQRADAQTSVPVAVALDRYGLSVVKCPRWMSGMSNRFNAGA